MTLTPEDQKLLRRPFTPEAVKFRIDGRPQNGKVRILTYIDSRLAAERLSEVDPDWEGHLRFAGHSELDSIGLSVGAPVIYSIVVKGSQRQDVGQIGKSSWGDDKGQYAADDKHAKMAVSDALKRAAVLFGVGAYLYTLGDVYVDVKKHTLRGEGKVLIKEGKAYLQKQYAEFIARPEFVKRFGEPISYGDELKNSSEIVEDTSAVAPQSAPDESASDPIEQSTVASMPVSQSTEDLPELDPHSVVVADLAKATGRSVDAALKWIAIKKNKDLAVKRAVRQAGERGADKSTVEKILKDNGLENHMKAFTEKVTA